MNIRKLFTIILLATLIKNQNSLIAQVLPQDSLALVAFYNSTGGPYWTNHTGWLTGPVSSWYGVTVEGNRVSKLAMYNNNLNGSIPSDIGNLSDLTNLALGYEPMLYGVIPQEIGQILELKGLFIGNCTINGTIPNTIGNCKNIHWLQLFGNSLTGAIPPEIGNLDSLLTLDLYDNQLTGPIPPEIGNCTQLVELLLNNNQLSGSIPAELANCNQIQTLDLSYNQLDGEVPYELAGVTSYGFLYLNNNHLTGIPPWNNNWFLNVLAIGGNCMTFEDLEPHFVGYMFYYYYPQDSMQTDIDTLLPKGSNFNIYSGSLGEYTTYYWFHNGVYMPGTENADTLKLININEADAGVYTCYAQSSICKEPNGMPMVLFRRPVTLGLVTGVEHTPLSDKIIAYPNPCNDLLTIETFEPFQNATIVLTNIYGHNIKQVPWVNGSEKQTISVQGPAKGIYILKLKDKNHTFTKRIVIN
ncbi:MAG TPA: T9SS type A sorting domain-containing protein [Bacteroidales bacterium]|mgnify:CR=1 FL=1|nr:T9SS type A sorting domain-containing protein [Bacteroidales bacterium]HPT03237.1 T9SS type A sorting domain-containing protein [Bacteroidales bacterium]